MYLNYASLGKRFVAFILDNIVLLLPFIMIHHIIPFLGSCIVWFFYAPFFESSRARATIGKHLMGIYVCDEVGNALSFKGAFVRNVMKSLSVFIFFPILLIPFFSVKKQALHDMISDSLVVQGYFEDSIFKAWLDNVKSVFKRI